MAFASYKICPEVPNQNIPTNKNVRPNTSRKATKSAAFPKKQPPSAHGKRSINKAAGAKRPVEAGGRPPVGKERRARNRGGAPRSRARSDHYGSRKSPRVIKLPFRPE